MPQMSPMSWSNLVFWFSIGTNFMKSTYRMTQNNSFYKTNQNKISLKNNNFKW